MKTVEQLNQQIAAQKARPKTDSVQARIESLERQINQILSADRKDLRKLRSRAIYLLGSTVIAAAEQSDGQHLATWLRDRVRQLPARDLDVIERAFPQVFSSGANAPAHAEPLPAEPVAQTNKETHHG